MMEELGSEYCTLCDDLTEIATRNGDVKVCYECLDLAEVA